MSSLTLPTDQTMVTEIIWIVTTLLLVIRFPLGKLRIGLGGTPVFPQKYYYFSHPDVNSAISWHQSVNMSTLGGLGKNLPVYPDSNSIQRNGTRAIDAACRKP